MRRLATRRLPDFDRLEGKILLASGTGTTPAAALNFSHNFLPPADAQSLQTDASNKNLEIFAARLAQLSSNLPDVQQFANQVILDDMTVELQGSLLAKNKNVILPPDLIGQDVTIARQLLASVNTTSFDQVFLTTMVQINTTAVNNGRQLATSTEDTDVRNYAQTGADLDQTHQNAAQNLLNATSSGIGNGVAPTPTNPTTVTTADATYLQALDSSNNFEILTSQIELLVGTNSGVQEYAQKLVFDHTVTQNKVMQLANANGVSLSPTLSAEAIATARSLLARANTTTYDASYLSGQVPMHRMTQQLDRQAASTTQNPNLRELARTDVATTAVHILAAQQLQSTQTNSLLPVGINSQSLRVQVRQLNRYTFTLHARINTGGLVYSSSTRVRFPRQSQIVNLPAPTRTQIRDALFASLNNFLNGIVNSSTGSGSGSSGGSSTMS